MLGNVHPVPLTLIYICEVAVRNSDLNCKDVFNLNLLYMY